MSKKENYLDNAEMESLFGRLKTECFYSWEFNCSEEIIDTVRYHYHYYSLNEHSFLADQFTELLFYKFKQN